MIERWRGIAGAYSENRQYVLHEDLHVEGFVPLRAAEHALAPAEYLGWLDVDNPMALLLVIDQVMGGAWALVSCVSNAWEGLFDVHRLTSPHGSLAGGAFYHAVLVVAADDRSIALLDPWHGPEGQPIALSHEDFASAWTGETILIHRDTDAE
ncbi:MAG: hypothetical protein KC420_00825 [Myxococcales bacterium]|nr:hypothetical protein [Myxococcales bacterium]